MKKDKQNSLAIFETYKIRRMYNEQEEAWYFSVIDIIAALTEQSDFKKAKSYWTTLKNRLKNEGSQLVTKCDQLKLVAQVALEEKIGKSVITGDNFLPKQKMKKHQ